MNLPVFSSDDLSEASGVELFRVFMAYRAMAQALEYMVDTQQNGEMHHSDPAAWFQKVKSDYASCIAATIDIVNEAGRREPANENDQSAISAILSVDAIDRVEYGVPKIG